MISPLKWIADKIPARLNIGIMSFVVCFIAYVFRSNLSITILAMIKDDSSNAPIYGPQYEWTDSEKGWLMGAFFWGSFVGTIPAGLLSELYGGKTVTTIGLFISGLFTALTPFMCDLSFWAFFINRVFIGIAGGIFYPALHNIVAKWAPPHEKGKFVAALLGGNLGTVVTFQLGSIIMVQFGWVWLYYSVAIITFIVMVFWMYLVTNQPNQHARISREELQYIEEHLSTNVSKKRTIPPYGQMMISVPFIALIILHFGSLWGLFFLLTAAPEFMNKVLGFDLTKAGFLASLPHLARFLTGFGFGYIGDILRRRQWMTPTAIRKVFCIFSHVIPGLLIISIIFVGNEGSYAAYACVAIITASLGANGAAAITNLQNSQDLAPNFAGALYSVINFIGTSSGFISSMVVANFTTNITDDNPMGGWNIVLIVGGVIYIVPALLFMLFGSGDVQRWNEISEASDTTVIDTERASDSQTEPN